MRLWQESMIFLARNEAIKNFMQSRATMSDLATRFVGGRNVKEAAEILATTLDPDAETDYLRSGFRQVNCRRG